MKSIALFNQNFAELKIESWENYYNRNCSVSQHNSCCYSGFCKEYSLKEEAIKMNFFASRGLIQLSKCAFSKVKDKHKLKLKRIPKSLKVFLN